MSKISPSDPDVRAVHLSKTETTVDDEEEYQEFVRSNPPPSGYVWARSPFTSGRKWKVFLKEETKTKNANTGLEQRLRNRLQEWGYWNHFEQDFRLPDDKQLDFADDQELIALEPGAVYWHTPKNVEGQAKQHLGENPNQVYSPTEERDSRKQKMLRDNGWEVLWITSTGVDEHSEQIRQWLAQRYE